MAGLIERFFKNYCPICKADEAGGKDSFYSFFRIVVGLLFMQHGAQKLFGFFGGVDGSGLTVSFASQLGVAGAIELFGGLLIVLGVFTRLIAFVAVIEMAVAYFMVHFPQDFFPIINRGELALLYLVSFLLMVKYGANKWSLERQAIGKEIF